MGGRERQLWLQRLSQLLHSPEGKYLRLLGQCSTGQSYSIRRLTQVGQQPARLIFQVGVLLPELAGAFP